MLQKEKVMIVIEKNNENNNGVTSHPGPVYTISVFKYLHFMNLIRDSEH